jgi:hypothetical protein
MYPFSGECFEDEMERESESFSFFSFFYFILDMNIHSKQTDFLENYDNKVYVIFCYQFFFFF